jgi:hypothetical protein
VVFADNLPPVGEVQLDLEYVDLALPAAPTRIAPSAYFILATDGKRVVYRYLGDPDRAGLYVSEIPGG